MNGREGRGGEIGISSMAGRKGAIACSRKSRVHAYYGKTLREDLVLDRYSVTARRSENVSVGHRVLDNEDRGA